MFSIISSDSVQITAWLAFNFDSFNTIEKNIEYYKRLVFTLKESNAGIPTNAITSRLLTSLPSDFAAFKQAWSTRNEEDKQFESLIELIRSEAARRAIEGGIGDVTTLITGFNRKNPSSTSNASTKLPTIYTTDYFKENCHHLLVLWKKWSSRQ